MNTILTKIEVMKTIGEKMDHFINTYLTPIEKIWQPSDFLPDSSRDTGKNG